MELTAREHLQPLVIENGTDLIRFSVEELEQWLSANEGPHDASWVGTDSWQLWQAVSGFLTVLRIETQGGVHKSVQSAALKKLENGEYAVEQVRQPKAV